MIIYLNPVFSRLEPVDLCITSGISAFCGFNTPLIPVDGWQGMSCSSIIIK